MNVNVPGQTGGTPEGDLSWFGGIVGIMIFVAVAGYIATLRYLKR
jgi:Mg2+ and Co2+ transporter CorA